MPAAAPSTNWYVDGCIWLGCCCPSTAVPLYGELTVVSTMVLGAEVAGCAGAVLAAGFMSEAAVVLAVVVAEATEGPMLTMLLVLL